MLSRLVRIQKAAISDCDGDGLVIFWRRVRVARRDDAGICEDGWG